MAESTPSWHSLDAVECVAVLHSDLGTGLTQLQAESQHREWGPNRLPEAASIPMWRQLGREFANPLTGVLALAVGLTIYLGDYIDSVVITVVILINALIGFIQEFRAEAALAAVSRLLSPSCVVLRESHPLTVESRDVVPGDIVLLSTGDRIPADLRLVTLDSLEVDESALTGESVPVRKAVDSVAASAPLAERWSMAYAGTVVTRGVARGLVVATGAHTELGQIGQMMRRVERLRTPLTRRLDTVARQITIAVMAVSIAILAWGLVAQEWEFDFLVVAVVGLAVGAIPEGLTIAASEDAPQRLVVAPANAGKAIVDAVVENKRRITIGQDAKTMWALNRMNPDTAANLIYKGMKDLLS